MSFVKTCNIDNPEEDTLQIVQRRDDYDAMSDDELSDVFEDLCYEACDQADPQRAREAIAAIAAMDASDAQIIIKNAAAVVAHQPTTTRRKPRQRGAVNRSSARPDDGDSEPRSSRSASLKAQKAAASSWLAANKDWDKDLPSSNRVQADHNYYTPANPAASETLDYRRAVSEPVDLPPLPREKSAEKRRISYVTYEYVAPAQIAAPDDYEDARIAITEAEAVEALREIEADRLLSAFDGPSRQRDVLRRLIWGWSISEIAGDLDLSDRRVRQIMRGNPARHERGIVGFLEEYRDQPAQQGMPAGNHANPIAMDFDAGVRQ